MALAVASTSSATVSDAASVTVTKPTGVAVGDLLLIATHASMGTGGNATCTGFSVAASNWDDEAGGLPDQGNTLLYRIADSSDVSAANYAVSHGGSNYSGTVAMLRVTGWTTGNPVFGTAVATGTQDATSFTLSASGLSLKRVSASSLILSLNTFHSNNSPYSSSTFSGYSITSGVANPTWIEIVDATISMFGGLDKASFACAYATTTDTSDITAFSVTGATDTGGTADTESSLLVVINEANSPTADVSPLAVTPTVTSPTAANSVAGTISPLAVTPVINGFTTRGDTLNTTRWTNPDKGTTTWTNPDK